ncbi:MAG: putative metal-dependent HD superfamily phosphohydrolase [Gammaproteobacteria bacterium]|jgi:predicted metal-dependent HD superfamily phosphohydrolase
MDKRRFEQLWRRCATDIDSVGLETRFEEIQARYNESHRRYHRPEHITHCLQQFDAAHALLQNADAVELAVWYHDVVYDIGAVDNEACSAQFFARHASGELSEKMIETVHELIMVTMHLCSLPTTSDEAYFVDIDLSSFGLSWDKFLLDSVDVRDEFPHVPDLEFYFKQNKFLLALLGREHFCFTAFFRDRHEHIARDNITSYLRKLKERGLLE